LSAVIAECGNSFHNAEVQWLSCETVMKLFLVLRLEMEMSMNEKEEVVTEFSDENWLWDSNLLCDISHHLNNLNTKLVH
jgi:hypothetical protein